MHDDNPNITWVDAAQVESSQFQHSLSGPREITAVVDGGVRGVIFAYADGTTRSYPPHEELPILVGDAEHVARRGGEW